MAQILSKEPIQAPLIRSFLAPRVPPFSKLAATTLRPDVRPVQ